MLNNLIFSAALAMVVASAVALDTYDGNELNQTPMHSSPHYSSAGFNSLPNSTTQAFIKEIQQQLILSPSNIGRQEVLFHNPPDASNITFQFINATHKRPTGGEIVLGSVDKFPALIGTQVSAAVGFVDACGLNVPHSHPRANEFLTVVSGELIGGLMLENTDNATGNTNGKNPTFPVPMVTANLTNFTGMLFPQGLAHFQFNPTCEPATFTAAFDSLDAGRVQIANTFFSIDFDEVLITSLGGNPEVIGPEHMDKLRGHIPNAFAELIDTCVRKCKRKEHHTCDEL